MNLVVTATGDPAITDKIVKLSHNVLNAGVSILDIMSHSSEVLFCLICTKQIFEIWKLPFAIILNDIMPILHGKDLKS